jgi:hypothetical protein
VALQYEHPWSRASPSAFRWQKLLDESVYTSVCEIGYAENMSKSHVSCILRLARLAPDIRGDRRINPQQAAIVQRIFEDYARGISPRAIAKQLNREGVPSPSGKGWGPSTIHGNWQRATGILNNEAPTVSSN